MLFRSLTQYIRSRGSGCCSRSLDLRKHPSYDWENSVTIHRQPVLSNISPLSKGDVGTVPAQLTADSHMQLQAHCQVDIRSQQSQGEQAGRQARQASRSRSLKCQGQLASAAKKPTPKECFRTQAIIHEGVKSEVGRVVGGITQKAESFTIRRCLPIQFTS